MSFPEKVRQVFKELEKSGQLNRELATNLCDIEFCRAHNLQTQFPVLSINREMDEKGYRRYSSPHRYHLVVLGQKYLFTNNWFRKDKSKIADFLTNYLQSSLVGSVLGESTTNTRTTSSTVLRTTRVRRRTIQNFPEWELPTEEDIRNVAHSLTPHLKFLHPKIIEAIARSNREIDSFFREYLKKSSITCSSYIWDGSSTMFPGIRRANGNTDKEYHKKQLPEILRQSKQAIYIDDNSYPKHIWAYIFTGRQFSNLGPKGYELAHLFDHKAVERLNMEITYQNDSGYNSSLPVSGMFTSAAGIVYAPRSFVKITDHNLLARRLLQRKAFQFYGEVSEVLPPSIKLRERREWNVDDFRWGEPVGDPSRVEAFLDYRHERIQKILDLKIPKR